jgi:hypothetical protein
MLKMKDQSEMKGIFLQQHKKEPYEARVSRTDPWEPKWEVPMGDPIFIIRTF